MLARYITACLGSGGSLAGSQTGGVRPWDDCPARAIRSIFTCLIPWSHKPVSSKRAPREFRNWRVQGNPLTLRQPFANPVPTLRQPFANLLCQVEPLCKPLFPWATGTRLETLVDSFLVICVYCAAPIGAFFCPEIRAFTGFGARFLQPFPKSLVTVKHHSNTKMAVNSR